MIKLISILLILLLTVIIWLVSGKGRKSFKRAPKGMYTLCMSPMTEYVFYGLAAFIFVFMLPFAYLCIDDIGVEEGLKTMGPAIIAGIVAAAACIVAGYCVNRSRVYFNNERIVVEHPFRKSVIFERCEWGRTEEKGKGQIRFVLYSRDNRVITDASYGMINYERFKNLVADFDSL